MWTVCWWLVWFWMTWNDLWCLIVWLAGGLCNSECCPLAVQTLVYLGRIVKQWSSLNSVLRPRETYHWKNVMYVYDILCTDSDMKACTDSCDVWVARHDSLGKDDYARILRYLLIYGCTLFDIHTTLQQNRQNWNCLVSIPFFVFVVFETFLFLQNNFLFIPPSLRSWIFDLKTTAMNPKKGHD